MWLEGYYRPFTERAGDWWMRLRSRWLRWPGLSSSPTLPVKPPAAAKAKRDLKPPPDMEFGSFFFRDAILDQLDHYFEVLARMKKGDHQSYQFFSRLGGHIVPSQGWVPHVVSDHLPPWWRDTLPSTGGVFFGDNRIEEREKKGKVMWVRALYFQKYRRRGQPREVQPVSAGTVYSLTVYWDMPRDAGWNRKIGEQGIVQMFPVVIAEDGEVTVLRMLETKHHYVAGKKRYHGERREFHIPERRWGIPDDYTKWAKQHDEPVDKFLRNIFINAAEGYMMANAAMTRVAVTKGKLTGVFAVDIERTPYFFRDREVTVTESGARKRIFHIVRPHERINAGGHKSFVRMHFRGERTFAWNGYSISITVPGWHHGDFSDFDVGAINSNSEEYREAKREHDMLDPKAVAKSLVSWMNSGVGGVWHHRRRHRGGATPRDGNKPGDFGGVG